MVLHEIHRLAKRLAPFLRRTRLVAASAVRAPSLDTMRAAPRRGRRNLERPGGGMGGEVVLAIRDDDVVAFLKSPERARQLRRAVFIVMAKGFAVGCDHQRGTGLELERGRCDPLGKPRAVGQTVAER